MNCNSNNNNNMADLNFDVLEKRLEMLEKRVFGAADKDALYLKDMKPSQCTDAMATNQAKLSKAVVGKKKINKVYNRLQELQAYLDPATADEMTLSEEAKWELILAEEDFLQQQAARLETLTQLQDTMDSEHIIAVPGLTDKLQELSEIQLKQQDQAGGLSKEIQDLLSRYNSTITLLSKQFVRWDETITQLEQASQPKTPLD